MGRRQISEKFMLHELERFYDEYGKIPTSRDLTSGSGFPNWASYRNKFGSLGKAIELAGLPTDTYRIRPDKYTNDELVEMLVKFKEEFGRYPRHSELNKQGKFIEYPHVRTYENRFGSLNKALELAYMLDDDTPDTFLSSIIDDVAAKSTRTHVKIEEGDTLVLSVEEIDHILEALHGIYCEVCKVIRKKLEVKRKEMLDGLEENKMDS